MNLMEMSKNNKIVIKDHHSELISMSTTTCIMTEERQSAARIYNAKT